ncbi:MAG: HAMP domain-containing protein [Magnetococcales bacterium]|nr:HAMP domain-containing protein [Magnetococcales bacterium]
MTTRLGIRGKLFLTSLGMFLLVGLLFELYLTKAMRSWVESFSVEELVREAKSLAVALEGYHGKELHDPTALPALIYQLGEAGKKRITLIDPQGKVLADSGVDPATVSTLDNHNSRPEVIAAREKGLGLSQRFSDTLKASMLYAATPLNGYGGQWILRLQVSLAQVDETISHVRLVLFIAGILGLVTAMLVSAILAHVTTRRLRQMVHQAMAIADGHQVGLLETSSTDEISGIAGSFNRVSHSLANVVATLAQEKHRFETVLDQMSEPVFTLDERNRVSLINRAALMLIQRLDSEEALGLPLTMMLPVPEIEAMLQEVNNEAEVSISFSLGKGEEVRRLSAHAKPLTNRGGTLIVLHDITEMYRLEKMRREFVANVSHELRTPVSVLMANSEVLLDGAIHDPQAGPSLLQALHRNANRLSLIINKLLELSKIDSKKYALKLETINLLQESAVWLLDMRPRLSEKNITLEVAISADHLLLADPHALGHVMINLLDNALKYTPNNGQIHLRSQAMPHSLIIEVEDNGPGIPPEHWPRIFERFYRVDAGRARISGGAGLGLAIVKNFVEAMGGRVGVGAGKQQGALFWITLPIPDPIR